VSAGGLQRAYLGLGSNLGDREGTLEAAASLIEALPEVHITAASGIYETDAVGGPEQPDYLNQVLEIETNLPPLRLLLELQIIERLLGRERAVRWGPRTIDVDILWYHGFSAADKELQLPHPRMEDRRFVLDPLAEIAPELVLPSGRTVLEALACVQDQAVRRVMSGGGS
jgi:2-amino-4-hydroxy-6-hydroxymethyldihydropteridine diphosphokinase